MRKKKLNYDRPCITPMNGGGGKLLCASGSQAIAAMNECRTGGKVGQRCAGGISATSSAIKPAPTCGGGICAFSISGNYACGEGDSAYGTGPNPCTEGAGTAIKYMCKFGNGVS